MKDASKDAFALLIAPHVDALYRASYRLTGNRPDAEDLFQEVCLRAYANLTEIGRVDQPKAWLLKVQYRLFVDGVRHRKRSPFRPMPDDPAAPALTSRDPGPDALVEGALTARRLRDAWQHLEKDQRALLALHAEGYTLAELHAVTDLSTDVLKARLYRARVRLGKLLATETSTSAVAMES